MLEFFESLRRLHSVGLIDYVTVVRKSREEVRHDVSLQICQLHTVSRQLLRLTQFRIFFSVPRRDLPGRQPFTLSLPLYSCWHWLDRCASGVYILLHEPEAGLRAERSAEEVAVVN